MPYMKKVLISLVVLAVGVGLPGLAAWKIKDNYFKKPQQQQSPPPQVTTAVPERKTVANTLQYVGNTEAMQAVDIRARVPGYLQEINFIGNTDVKEGDLLFTIEPDSYKASRDRAYANLKSAEAELLRAEKDLERMEKAVKTNSVSRQKVSTVKSQRDQAKAAVLAAEASLAEAELNLSYTNVRAPISGRISRRFVDSGNLIGSGNNTLLARIVDIDPIYVFFKVNEKDLLKRLKKRNSQAYKEDVEVYIGLADEKGYPHKGIINYVDNRVDQQTGTIEVRAVVDNPDNVILPGMFVRIKARNGMNENALLVEEKALGTDFNGKYLLIVGENNVVEQRPVEIGSLVDGMRVIKEGLKKDEKYIVSGLQFARPGQPVTPMPKGSQQTMTALDMKGLKGSKVMKEK